MLGVAERLSRAVALLIGFVTLARQQHDVAAPGLGDRARDGDRAVELDRIAPVARVANAVHDFAGDRGRVFAARVVAGDQHPIGELPRKPAHLGPLAPVALAAGAEQADELAALTDRG